MIAYYRIVARYRIVASYRILASYCIIARRRIIARYRVRAYAHHYILTYPYYSPRSKKDAFSMYITL